jgi:hypothetical protein
MGVVWAIRKKKGEDGEKRLTTEDNSVLVINARDLP